MTDDDLITEARSLGFAVLEDAAIAIDSAAARLIPAEIDAVGVAVHGDVVHVVVDHLPSPGEFRELESATKALVTISVATKSVYEALRERSRTTTTTDGSARSLGPVLALAVQRNATDVHLSVGTSPKLRVAGELQSVEQWPALSAADMEGAARWVLGAEYDTFESERDVSVSYADSRWRVNVYRQRHGVALALRRIPGAVPRLEELDLPVTVVNLANLTQGLVLFCGPTGHGKTTSLAALVNRINETRNCHILTIEDPIEYVHSDLTATIHQREVGTDTPDFATALRAALREDIDVLLVGELRDAESMQMALSAAETGHLVLATVHANDAMGVFRRIVDSFPAAQQDMVRTQLAATMRAVVAQLLLPSTTPGRQQLVCEVLVATPATRNIIRDNRIHQLITTLDTSRAEGMQSMDRSLALAVAAGRISPEVAEMWVKDITTYGEQVERSPVRGKGVTRGRSDSDITW